MERDRGARSCRGWAPCLSWPQRVLSVEALGHRVRHHRRNRRSRHHGALSGVSRAVVPPAQHFLLVVAGTNRAATCFARQRNTIRVPAQQSHPRHRLVWQGVSDSGCSSRATGPRIGSCGSGPPKMALACAHGPFGEVASGILLAGRLHGLKRRTGGPSSLAARES